MPRLPSMPESQQAATQNGVPVFTSDQQACLLKLARLAIHSHWHSDLSESLSQAQANLPLAKLPLACFVTLHRQGHLRGCIGCLEPDQVLAEALVYFARAAAFHDPRFPPLDELELEQCEISISLLGPLTPLPANSRQQLLQALIPGVDGLWLESPGHRATFLPAVWREIPKPEQFLDQLLRKGGWPQGAWPANLQGYRYRSLEFCENGSE
jgi:uncharacterized protein